MTEKNVNYFDFTHFRIKTDIDIIYYLKKIKHIKTKVLIEKILLYILIFVDSCCAYKYFILKCNNLFYYFCISVIETILIYILMRMANYLCKYDFKRAFTALDIYNQLNFLTTILQPMAMQNIDSCIVKVIRNYNSDKTDYCTRVFGGTNFFDAPEEAKEEPAFVVRSNNEIQYITLMDICVIFGIIDVKEKYIKVIDGVPYWNYEYFEQHKKVYININNNGIYIE